MQGEVLASVSNNLVAQPHGIDPGDRAHRLWQNHHAVRSACKGLDATSSNIMTVEDPIEYELPGVGQTQVNAKIDLTFAKALRAILRQDPDVIMIGEIRDLRDGADRHPGLAHGPPGAGHLAHQRCQPAPSPRLTDMGIEPFLLSSSSLVFWPTAFGAKVWTHRQGRGCGHRRGKQATGGLDWHF
jgi:general secretion pathway protein E